MGNQQKCRYIYESSGWYTCCMTSYWYMSCMTHSHWCTCRMTHSYWYMRATHWHLPSLCICVVCLDIICVAWLIHVGRDMCRMTYSYWCICRWNIYTESCHICRISWELYVLHDWLILVYGSHDLSISLQHMFKVLLYMSYVYTCRLIHVGICVAWRWCICRCNIYTKSSDMCRVSWYCTRASRIVPRGGGLGSRPKKMYGERLGDGVEYHLMKPTPRR